MEGEERDRAVQWIADRICEGYVKRDAFADLRGSRGHFEAGEGAGAGDERIARCAGTAATESSGDCRGAYRRWESGCDGGGTAGSQSLVPALQDVRARGIWGVGRNVLDGSARDYGRLAGAPCAEVRRGRELRDCVVAWRVRLRVPGKFKGKLNPATTFYSVQDPKAKDRPFARVLSFDVTGEASCEPHSGFC